jgi:hypothetical protein
VLPGACLAYQFQLTGTGTEAAAQEISGATGLVSRDQLADQVRRYSGGRLRLDAAAAVAGVAVGSVWEHRARAH